MEKRVTPLHHERIGGMVVCRRVVRKDAMRHESGGGGGWGVEGGNDEREYTREVKRERAEGVSKAVRSA